MKLGKKTKRNIEINRVLDELRIKMFLPDYCELRLPECKGGLFMTWAHAKRRTLWTCERDKWTVVRACCQCHTDAQNKGNDKNEQIILQAIAARGYDFADLATASAAEKQTCPCCFCDCPNRSEYGEICGFCLLRCRGTEERREELELNRVY